MQNKNPLWILIAVGFLTFGCASLNTQKLSEKDRSIVDSILEKSKSVVEKKQARSNANLLTFEELRNPLSKEEKKLIQKILRLNPADLGVKTPRQIEKVDAVQTAEFHEVKEQIILKDGKPFPLPAPVVSKPAYAAYQKMALAMEKNLGKKLYIESGHRAPAYHLYNFLKYLAVHDYSLLETAKLNALPGYSEHNLSSDHAIDLINAEGINGEPKVEDYEALPEHAWMLKHAGEYGFTLSYPRENPWGISFEPWHWRYQEKYSPEPSTPE